MARARQPRLTFLDTHAVIWLYEGEVESFSRSAREAIETGQCLISPMVMLELEFLHEIGRNNQNGRTVVETVYGELGVALSQTDFSLIAREAMSLDWTRDPFDRLIVAEAKLHAAPLVTRDRVIRAHYPHAIW